MGEGHTWRRLALRWALVLVAAAALLVPRVRSESPPAIRLQLAAAPWTNGLEVSHSCVPVGQRIPTFLVWGSGFNAWFAQPGRIVTVEWHWGGEPSTPNPAVVTPASRNGSPGNFTLSYDVTGRSVGSGAFVAVARFGTASPTTVGSVNVDIRTTCPTGTATCAVDGTAAVLNVQTQGYNTSWRNEFVYQYHLPSEVGPVPGTAGADGIVRGQFRSPPRDNPALITARIIQPAQGDFSARLYDLSFPAPVCLPPRPTTTTTTTATTSPTSSTTPTTRPPGTSTTLPARTTTPVVTTGTAPTNTTAPVVTSTTVAPPKAGQPALVLNPAVGQPGFVTKATGTNFPPNIDVVVTWQGPAGSTAARTDGNGTFTVPLLVMPKDRPGLRTAVVPGHPSAVASFLVVPSTVRPPGRNGQLFLRG